MSIRYKFNLNLGCPIVDKSEKQHEYYYRISKNEEIQCEDFIPQYWSQKNRRETFKDKECLYQGLSLLGTLEEAINICNRFNGRLGDKIFKAKDLHKYGTIIPVPTKYEPNHINFYIYEEYCELVNITWEREEC